MDEARLIANLKRPSINREFSLELGDLPEFPERIGIDLQNGKIAVFRRQDNEYVEEKCAQAHATGTIPVFSTDLYYHPPIRQK